MLLEFVLCGLLLITLATILPTVGKLPIKPDKIVTIKSMMKRQEVQPTINHPLKLLYNIIH